ncbi:hypothetical protein [Winogradskyella sp. PC D3.3]
MKKMKFYLLLPLIMFAISCEQENVSDLPENGLNLELDLSNVDFKMTNQFDLNKVSLDDVIELTIKELYSKDYDENIMMKNQNSTDEFIDGFDINIKDDLITISPITDPVVNGACGSGSGWKKFGTCYSESCVKSKMEAASKELSDKLGSGQCMDLRVKRNSLNAVVCGRVIDC